MNHNHDNRKRIFSEIISLEAWHDAFSEEASQVSLHADVVFSEGRVGGESEAKVRFKLSIERAELIIIVPEAEPLSIDRSTVSRDDIAIEGKKVSRSDFESHKNIAANSKIELSPSAAKFSLDSELGGGVSSNTHNFLETTEVVRRIRVQQKLTPDNNYKWDMQPGMTGPLEGRPWDAVKEPRLSLIDTRKDRKKGIPPVVRIEVRCRREDLKISNIELKDKSSWKSLVVRENFRNKIIAAEAYIRDRLSSEDLEFSNISDPFGEITIARVFAESN